MGNLLGQDEQQLTQSLHGEYQIESHPYLLHRQSNQLCLLHKVTTNSTPNSHRILQIIEEYSRSKCASISTLKTHHRLDKSGYCSNQQTYYLIFLGQNNYTLKEEVTKRRFYQQAFREDEIRNIIETYLCGLRQYNHRFQREYERLATDSLVLDLPSQRIYLRDPWLNALSETESSNNITHIMQTYPSPQKLNALLSHRTSTYSEFLSSLFSIGVISLELKRLDFADGIYTKKKEVNLDELYQRINDFRDPKLRMGVQLLLSMDPNARKQIFTVWGIENREEHHLVPFNQEKNMQEVCNKQPIRSYQEHPPRSDLTQTHKTMYHSVRQPPLPPPSQSSQPAQLHTTREVKSAQVESVYAPKPQHQPNASSNGRPKTNIHFSRPNSQGKINQGKIHFQAVVPPTYLARPNEQIHFKSVEPNQLKKIEPLQSARLPSQLPSQPVTQGSTKQSFHQPQTNKKFLSFQDYLSKEDTKPQTYSSEISGQPIQFQKNTTRFSNGTNNPPKQASRGLSALGPHKESFTFHEQPSNQDQLPKESQQTHTESPHERISNIKQNNHVQVREQRITSQQPEKQTTPPEPKKDSPTHIRSHSDQPTVEISPVKPNPHINQADNFLIKQDEQSLEKKEKVVTPTRPPSKNKFNSTIVEVRDEDTPEHSNNSEDGIQQEYVVEEYETGSRYEGFKSGGMRNGKGKFYYQDGGYYEGHWKSNKMDGYGKLYYQGGKLAYEGMWSQDEFNGVGKVYNDNPVTFSTSFDYTNFDYLEDYWEYYEGMLSKDTKEGRGRIKLSNGQIFEGDFHEDKIQGFGKFHTLEDKVVEGMWRDSKLIKIINNG